MENLSFTMADVQYLLFIIPGFIVVWSYRFFSKHKSNIGEFEYAGLSFIWGLLLVASGGFFLNKLFPGYYQSIIKNIYATNITFCFLGLVCGWIGGFVKEWRWWNELISFIKPENYIPIKKYYFLVFFIGLLIYILIWK
ncbi:MAG: hypothetical protein JNN11_00840 [Candidatus Doudnabacteria bacterium]|nr:hypothetical protein [Candidatus Doudnabacteria bacterium]